MFLKSSRNILVDGQHIAAGEVFETDIDTANRLLATHKVEVCNDPKKPEVKKADK